MDLSEEKPASATKKIGPEAQPDPTAFLSVIASNPRGEPMTWGATPLEVSREIFAQQNHITSLLESCYTDDVPKQIPGSTVGYIYDLGMQRAFNRASKNHENFGYRQKQDIDDIDLEALGVYYRAITGHASPAELLYVQKLFGVAVIELASLTHPYGKRIEMLDDMRAATAEAITLYGGRTQQVDDSVYAVKGCDAWLSNDVNQPSQALLMTRTRTLGQVGYELDDKMVDVNISERSSFVLRLDEASGFDQDLANRIRFTAHSGHYLATPSTKGGNVVKLLSERVMQVAPELISIVEDLLENNRYDKAIPLSTTVLAKSSTLEALHNSSTARKYQAAYVANAAIRRAE